MMPYWNGEECEAEKVRVIVGDTGRFPEYWAREFVGQEREAVKVTVKGYKPFYIDNERGQGWYKVTIGAGSMNVGHDALEVEKEIEPQNTPSKSTIPNQKS